MGRYVAPPGGFRALTTLTEDYTKELYLAHPTTRDIANELNDLVPTWAKQAKARAEELAKQVKDLKLEVQELKDVAENARKDLEAANRILHALLTDNILTSDPSKWGEDHLAADPSKPAQVAQQPPPQQMSTQQMSTQQTSTQQTSTQQTSRQQTPEPGQTPPQQTSSQQANGGRGSTNGGRGSTSGGRGSTNGGPGSTNGGPGSEDLGKK